MPVLTRPDILDRIARGDVRFTPALDAFQLQPHAVDLRLGYKFLIPKNWTLDEKGRRAISVSIERPDAADGQFEEVVLKPGQYFELLPNEFVIGTSLEEIELSAPDLMALLFPRTSTNRRGIDLSLSGIIDAGYKGRLIFPMKNEAGDQVLRVWPGERVCQVIFETLSTTISAEEADRHGLASAKYSANGAQTYRLDKEEEREALTGGGLEELKKKFDTQNRAS